MVILSTPSCIEQLNLPSTQLLESRKDTGLVDAQRLKFVNTSLSISVWQMAFRKHTPSLLSSDYSPYNNMATTGITVHRVEFSDVTVLYPVFYILW